VNKNIPLDGVIGVEENNTAHVTHGEENNTTAHVVGGEENNTTQRAHAVGGEERTILQVWLLEEGEQFCTCGWWRREQNCTCDR
jgi:hypothetical protein